MSPHKVVSPRNTEIELEDLGSRAADSLEVKSLQSPRTFRRSHYKKSKKHKKRLIPIDDDGDEAYSSDNEGMGEEKQEDIRLDIKIANKLSRISLTQTVTAIPKELSNFSSRALERAKSLQSGPKASPAELVWQEEENFMRLPESFFQLVKAEANFVNHLVNISQELCELEPSKRLSHLKGALRILNSCLPKEGAFIPLSTVTDKASCILRVPADECFVFSTKERAPYMMCVEVVSQSFRWSSHKVGTQEMQVELDGDSSRNMETQSDDMTSDVLSGNEGLSSFSPSSQGLMSPAFISAIPPLCSTSATSPPTDPLPTRCSEEPNAASADDAAAPIEVDPSGIEQDVPRAAEEGDRERPGETARSQTVRSAGHRVDPRLSSLKTEPDCKQFVDDRDNLTNTLGESWQQLEERIRSTSPHGSKVGWKLISVIVKSRDDLRQEQFAVQLITLFQQIFKKANLPVWLQPYQVLATSADAGLIQVVTDTISLHGLKKKLSGGERGAKQANLSRYFEQRYGRSKRMDEKARENFMLSLAAYSVVCYLLQIKDRHNGNILIDNAGHVVHIDYGFMLSNSPGNIGFEKAAFKLTKEMVDVMGGEGGRLFEDFRSLSVMCYLEARKHAQQILMMVEVTRAGQPDLPCFTSRTVLEEMQERFKLDLSRKAAGSFFESLIHEAIDHWCTRQYDKFQWLTNGIMS
uniref:1-phosphatidylinositol 4-kinase n=1 Tax=Hanusia phi TaxID=3032 RepID=A0A7S0HF68_9CRYP|mmetsp:Transcript_1900/g.4201  ORF Transcript_1900/g.4201 Transcript_1900/m.4201 type:complete len:694 (+) Transcript_1900:1557-3638(+)